MATIPGSHFTVTAGLTVNVVETTTGIGLPPAIPGDFNLEVFVGADANAPPLAAGYDGLAVLSPSGLELDLFAGAFAVTDNGTMGNDTLSAFGTNETIIGAAGGTTLNLPGNGDTAVGGGGPDTISVSGDFDSVSGGSGNDTINVSGVGDTVTAGSGHDLINVSNSLDLVNGSSGSDTIVALGNFDTINGGTGPTESISATGAFNTVNLGTGSDTVNLIGTNDTVTSGVNAGAGQNGLINLSGVNMTVADGPNQYSDTVVGFSQAAGDTIKLSGSGHTVASTMLVNGNADTLITLNDGSTILLKGVTNVNGSFFS
jgi:Ca2+-binding RTX toxin-like protein